MLSAPEIRKLAGGSGDEYLFDFSVIDSETYQPLLIALQHFAPKNIVDLGFSCDQMAEELITGEFSETVMQSAAKNRTNYVRNMIELLSHILKKSTVLESLELSNIELKKDQLSKLCDAIEKCTRLKKITINRVLIGDDGLMCILNSLNPSTIKRIRVTECGLTKNSTQVILDFIKSKKENEGIKEFEVAPGDLPKADIDAIAKQLGSKKIKIKTPQKKSLEQLQKENEELKEELERLKSQVSAVKYNDRVYVIGKGASQFVRFLGSVESRIRDLEEQRSSMETFL